MITGVKDSEILTITVHEAARLLRISRTLAYEAVRNGTLPSVKIGRRLLIPIAALERMLEGTAQHDTNGSA
jgi:excisionase family DNA binding protein